MLSNTSSSTTEQTRKQIVQAAEKLFAEKGFRAMTLRDVTREAKVNLAAVNYHFGSKGNLMHEVIRGHIEPVNQERLKRLNAATAEYTPNAIPLECIFDTLFRPLFEHAAKSNFPQLIGRAITEPAEFLRNLHKKFFVELSQRYLREIQRSCPKLSEEDIQYRFFLSVGTMIGTIIDQVRLENISGGKLDPKKIDRVVNELTNFVVAGFKQHTETITQQL
jgi:AcrR family transcriptional regulator